MSQEHYLMACLEKFGLTDCNNVDKPIASRLTVQDQQEVPNSTAQELYHAWLAVSSVLLRGLVLTLPLRSLSCLVSWQTTLGSSQTCVSIPQEDVEFWACLRLVALRNASWLTPCGVTLAWTGLAALTLVGLLRALCSCSTVLPSHGAPSVSLPP